MKRYVLLLIVLFTIVSVSGFGLSWYALSELHSALNTMVEAGKSAGLRDRLYISVEQLRRLKLQGVDDATLKRQYESIKAISGNCKGCHHTGEALSDLTEITALVEEVGKGGFQDELLGSLWKLTRDASQEGQTLMEERSRRAERISSIIIPLFFGTVFLIFLILILFSILVLVKIQSTIENLLSATRRIGAGEETSNLEFTGEFKQVGDAFSALQRELKIKEEKLLNWSRHWQETFDSIDEMMAVTDAEGSIVQTNRAFKEHFGTSGEGESLYDLVCREYFELEDCPIQETIKTGKPVKRLLEKGQTVISVSTYPLKSNAGLIHGGIWVGKDISKEREMEERALQSEKLVALGELVAGIAHELNNPLSVSLGYSEILLERKDISDEDRRKLEKIFSATKRASNIIKNLLEFARKQPLREEPCQIDDIVERMVDLLIYELRSSGIELRMDLGAPPPVMGDPVQLGQVVINLLKNAQDALGEREQEEKVITIETGERTEGVYLSVSDNGPGIPEEILSRIFEPFFTTKDVGKGTGLGLSITYSIVKGHGGELIVENLPEGGVEFTAIFPPERGETVEEDTGNR